jgi:outer membrane protein OmpA-like peptidoglycan-associated protein
MGRACLAALLCLSLAVPAVAADAGSTEPSVDLQLFWPAAGANDFITVETGDINSHLGVSLGLSLNYARNPLAVQILRENGSKDDVGAIVANRIDTQLVAALGLFDIGELGVAVPVVWQGGFDTAAFAGAGVQVGIDKLTAFSLGTVRLIPKARLLSLGDGLLSAALLATVGFPTGSADYAREAGMFYAPTVALSSRAKFLRAGLDVGYRLRDTKTRVEPVPGQVLLTVANEVFAKAAVAFDVNLGKGKPFEIVGEVFGHTPADNAFGRNAADSFSKKRQKSRTSAEGDLGLRWSLTEKMTVTAGVGGGLTTQGYGQPAPRFFVGFMHYTGSSGVVDSDLDGVPDAMDQCPDKKEDKDGFEDGDGCPDLDNDKDGVSDDDDQCPNEAGPQTNSGCPKFDQDNDGVLDDVDKCPDQPEDLDGFEDKDGCPDYDNDNDKIPDTDDLCPNEPEDMDGFQDQDGCPDLDNDNDGLPDLGDMCPNYPEDKDGVADDDGCPEDNDNDGIPDDLDKCPDKAEDYNGIEDEDGCPDTPKAKVLVVVTEDKIEIKETILFKTGSAKIMPKSFGLLNQVVAVLKNYKHIKKVRVEGHTDNVGDRKRNLKLSKDRAASVKEYLIDKGIDAGRLESEGFGPDKPIQSNKTAKGREINRRVEFMIVEQTPIGKDVGEGQAPPTPPAGGGEPVFDLGPATAPLPAPKPPPAGGGEPVFDLGQEPTPPPAVAPPPPAPEPKPAKGKAKGKGKKKAKEDKKADDEVKFDF